MSQVDMRVRVIRLKPNNCPVFRERAGDVLGLGEDVPQSEMGLGEIRLPLERTTVEGHCLRTLVLTQTKIAHCDQRLWQIGIQMKRRIERGGGLVEASLADEQRSKVGVEGGRLGTSPGELAEGPLDVLGTRVPVGHLAAKERR